MAALKDIKRKINAVQKTRQITRAMNMVAASKFKAAQLRMLNFRPYAESFMEMLGDLAGKVSVESNPLLAVREPKRIKAILMTSDRGLCGGFNNNLTKATERFVLEKQRLGLDVELIPVGRKGRDFFKKKFKISHARSDVFGKFDMNLAISIANDIIPPFIAEEYDELYLIYNEFINVSIQKPRVLQIFPIAPFAKKAETDIANEIEYIYEPAAKNILENLLPMYVHVLIYRALAETSAGENGARMAAMDNATRNCEEMVSGLTLKYNKARQAAITSELMDIVGGTEALAKG
ncbi:MAG: ATP synthase F1 subunit gamma [Syntrophales bacterium]